MSEGYTDVPAPDSSHSQGQCCKPIRETLSRVGDKWSMLIVGTLKNAPLRFNELRRLIPSVTQRMLTLQLRELEQDDIINRKVYPEVPPKVEYSLTEFGKTLKPHLLGLREWGAKIMKRASK